MKLLTATLLVSLTATLSACTSYYGHSADEWRRLGPQEQAQAIAEYNDVKNAKDAAALGDPREESKGSFQRWSIDQMGEMNR